MSQAPGQRFCLIPTRRIALASGKAYNANLHIKRTVNVTAISNGTWDLEAAAAAAEAKDWTGLLCSSITTLAEAFSHALELVAESKKAKRKILIPWESAVRPACAPCACACSVCGVSAAVVAVACLPVLLVQLPGVQVQPYAILKD